MVHIELREAGQAAARTTCHNMTPERERQLDRFVEKYPDAWVDVLLYGLHDSFWLAVAGS